MRIDEMTSSEIFTALTEQQKDDIYRMVWFSHVIEDAKGYMRDFYAEEELPADEIDAIAESVANAYVYNGDYDCTFSYWDNIEKLIEKYREN